MNVYRKFFLKVIISFLARLFLSHADPPVVTVSPTNVTVNESSDILIECDVIANPPELLAVRW